jgi:hypothetical protein
MFAKMEIKVHLLNLPEDEQYLQFIEMQIQMLEFNLQRYEQQPAFYFAKKLLEFSKLFDKVSHRPLKEYRSDLYEKICPIIEKHLSVLYDEYT